jgi:hypothetical protein
MVGRRRRDVRVIGRPREHEDGADRGDGERNDARCDGMTPDEIHGTVIGPHEPASIPRPGPELGLLDARDELEVFDGRERLVKVMEEQPPLVVFGRAAKAFGVIFESLPYDQQEVSGGRLEATLKIE